MPTCCEVVFLSPLTIHPPGLGCRPNNRLLLPFSSSRFFCFHPLQATWRGATIAVKKISLPDDLSVRANLMQDFEREVRLMADLQPHPNVVPFLFSCVDTVSGAHVCVRAREGGREGGREGVSEGVREGGRVRVCVCAWLGGCDSSPATTQCLAFLIVSIGLQSAWTSITSHPFAFLGGLQMSSALPPSLPPTLLSALCWTTLQSYE